MSSKRDKDFHFLRNAESYLGGRFYKPTGLKTREEAEMQDQYNKVWKKYGLKSMVMDKRRRNTTRKSNQKGAQIERQIQRAKLKRETQGFIKEVFSVVDPEDLTTL